MDTEDAELILAASEAIKRRYDPDWHVVGAALRLKTGEIVTGVHLEATVGRIAVCAEAIALGRAVTEHGSADVEAIAAVYHPSHGEPYLCAPCGMCRELIADYSPDAAVLIAGGDGAARRIKIAELLPSKYSRSPQGPASSHSR